MTEIKACRMFMPGLHLFICYVSFSGITLGSTTLLLYILLAIFIFVKFLCCGIMMCKCEDMHTLFQTSVYAHYEGRRMWARVDHYHLHSFSVRGKVEAPPLPSLRPGTETCSSTQARLCLCKSMSVGVLPSEEVVPYQNVFRGVSLLPFPALLTLLELKSSVCGCTKEDL